ncbi:MAG: ABC transporter permease [Marinovum algicola]|jgi:peptide/nickel transport system permease protein|uniref:Peptide/nickel transport system permease protein n=3 Tax=Marinovum algicola TaxID=42444 RepID=A0A975WCZ2_9RHOB|nr:MULTISPECIES: ABC transporter permease [Marinovum]AKP00072.1 Dipeptide transport system permease protein DppC [Marinovum algicola DG 898]MDD9745154.1 ABC transporter permease [Marinovum sp. PR37]SEJ96595.1 peptide/nickel transport system permease protein [Marinovum algicola]SLN69468.1 Dipeptide transport system permease protein DppC [Marinovum algicola]
MSLEAFPQSRLAAIIESDLFYKFRTSWITVGAFVVTLVIVLAAVLAPWIAPHDPFDVSTLSLWDSELPPVWAEGGDPRFLLGTDNQGRDVFSAILYGSRISLAVGFVSVAFAMVIGIVIGLVSGYFGGAIDAFFMRIADVMLSFPTILVALLVSGIVRGALPREMHDSAALIVLVFAITVTTWVQYARTVRSSTMVERSREYVYAAQLVGRKPFAILFSHILPNVMGPVLVIATINLAMAILIEATLSFLGVGMPPTNPSLGTLIRVGNEYLFSGVWWVVIFPSLTLVALVLAVNLLGDWLRDALNPKLR